MTIEELIKESHQTAVEHGWWEEERNIGECLALMHSEISEALEEWRDGFHLNSVYYKTYTPGNPNKPEGFTVELADLLIRVFDLCGRHKLQLVEALQEKMAYNKTRPYRHGGKVA